MEKGKGLGSSDLRTEACLCSPLLANGHTSDEGGEEEAFHMHPVP